jgi:sugar O-acyltransferase (sialic acid O-acetyltransferase NeuD family)
VVPVLGLGAGGHAKVVLEILRLSGGWEPVGLLDPRRDLWGKDLLGVPILGDDDLAQRQYDAGVRHAFIGLGGVGDNSPRRHLYEFARDRGFEIVTAIHPQAAVSPSATLAHGQTIGPCAVINACATLGENVIVNSSALVEHDCAIANHVHIASGARLASGVTVGEGAHIGLGASVRQGITVGATAVVGAGAAVISDVPPGSVVVGVPARVR